MNPANILRQLSSSTVEGRLFWASVLLLFAEIFAIRWLGIEVSVIRTFPNLVLLVVLVGASAGLGNPEKLKSPAWVILAACAVLILGLIFAVPLGLSTLSMRVDQSESLIKIGMALVVLMSTVLSLVLVSINIGCAMGREFAQLPALRGYAINLLGSIFGVIIFGLIAWLNLPPPVCLFVLGLFTWLLSKRRLVIGATVLFVALSLLTTMQSRWSPYSKLDVISMPQAAGTILGAGNYVLNSNNYYFHFAVRILKMDKAQEALFKKETENSPQLATVDHYYTWLKLPFQFAPQHNRVLVLGGGSGNDVAFALKNGAQSVDVVEIDPVIATFGKSLHPDKPYIDPKTSLHVEDARSFLRYSKDKYDLIEFAYLDPGATLNTASFIRVDNFVYTVESIKSALSHLDANGLGTISFATGPQKAVTWRLYQIIAAAQGKP
ncbi:MAG: hypothetical protein K2X81_16850, partial [Candidatus Obscuribacterales bacterium]|nr:hypothetical protein [Candidatus Obscuribacterales bacterium]